MPSTRALTPGLEGIFGLASRASLDEQAYGLSDDANEPTRYASGRVVWATR